MTAHCDVAAGTGAVVRNPSHYRTRTMAVPISQRFAERMRAPTRNWVRLAWTAPQNTPSARTVSET